MLTLLTDHQLVRLGLRSVRDRVATEHVQRELARRELLAQETGEQYSPPGAALLDAAVTLHSWWRWVRGLFRRAP